MSPQPSRTGEPPVQSRGEPRELTLAVGRLRTAGTAWPAP